MTKLNFLNISLFFSALLGLSIIVLPLAADRSNLPLGWDIPKAHSWGVFVCLISILLLIENIFTKYKLNVKRLTLLAFVVFSTFLSTLLSDYARYLGDSASNPIYSFLKNDSYPISLIGNKYREQGYLIFLLSLTFFYLVSKHLKTNGKLILAAFSISGIFQIFYSIPQLIRLQSDSPKLVNDGVWIYGSFGQANFYAGIMLVASLSSIALVFLVKKRKVKALLLLAAFLNFTGLVISFSPWAIATYFVFQILMFLHFLLKPNRFIKILNLSLGICAILVVPVAIIADKNIEEFRQRYDFWQANVDIYTLSPFEKATERSFIHSLFGDGLDTLSYTYKDYGYFSDLIVDRSHNFFLDILASFGLVGIVFFLSLLVYIQYNLQKYNQFKITIIFDLLLWAWLARSFIHTSSILNLVEFAIILTMLLTTLNTKDTPKNSLEL